MNHVHYDHVEIQKLLSDLEFPAHKIDNLAHMIWNLSYQERADLAIVLNLMSWNAKELVKK